MSDTQQPRILEAKDLIKKTTKREFTVRQGRLSLTVSSVRIVVTPQLKQELDMLASIEEFSTTSDYLLSIIQAEVERSIALIHQ